MPTTNDDDTLLEVERVASVSGAFGTITRDTAGLCCAARGSSAPAHYGVKRAGDRWLVSLATPDRWLSESIETSLLHSRDTMEDLLLDELKDRDWTEGAVAVKHFRDETKCYVFEAALPASSNARDDIRRLGTLLVAFEGTFSELGDMSEAESP